MGISYKADSFSPPTAGTAQTVMVFSLPCTTSVVVHDLGTTFLGRYVTFVAEDSYVRVLCSSTDTGLTVAAPSGTAIATSGIGPKLYADTPQSWVVDGQRRYIATLAGAATTYLVGYVSSPD